MKRFTNALINTWQMITHRLGGLTSRHTTNADIPTKKTHHNKHKAETQGKQPTKHKGIRPQRTVLVNIAPEVMPYSTATDVPGPDTPSVLPVEPIVTEQSITASEQLTANELLTALDTQRSLEEKQPSIVELVEKNPRIAQKAQALIDKHMTNARILTFEGKDTYDLRGRLAPEHRRVATQEGYRYLTTQKAIEEKYARTNIESISGETQKPKSKSNKL